MSQRRGRMVLFVEGPGDFAAVPILVKRLLAERNAFDSVFVFDSNFYE